ncbi:MAG: hypothetical protein EA350_05810 [Gemmatimonadales bacterium]|nr:MAG: hypothetical protein EA350_05810 [Gemmatimonadales bacterium]
MAVFGGLALALSTLVPPGALEGQHTGDLVIPRGAILVEAFGLFSQAAERFEAGGRVPLGVGAFDTGLDPARFPALEAEEAVLRTLVADPSLALRAGRFRSVLEMNEQRVPLRVGYGLMDRLTVGVTVPLVRRRMDAHLQATGAGANVGQNPADYSGTAAAVATFRSDAAASLQALRTRVNERCDAEGPSSEACLAGRAAESRVGDFLGQLNEAWDTLDLFPLVGSTAGGTLRARWTAAQTDLEAWNVDGPETLPLAVRTSPSTLRQQLSDPVWGDEGFPVTTPDAFLVLGDVEIHAVLGLFGQGASQAGGSLPAEGFRVRSAVEGTLRLATGVVDSFAVVTPSAPLAGHGGLGVRWVTDLLVGERAGVLVDLGWQAFSEGEGRMLAFDPDNAWNPDLARVTARGTPGDRLRLAVTPRFIVVPGLSLGAGVEVIRTGEGRWTATATGQPGGQLAPERMIPSWSSQQGVVELRFAGWEEPLVGGLPFPVELSVRGVAALSGSGGAPVERRLEMGARVLRRR